MSLAISTCVLSDVRVHDPEAAEWLREDLAALNAVLHRAGLPQHTEPEDAEPLPSRSSLAGLPYSHLHHLRLACARHRAAPAWRATPLPEGSDPTDDPQLDAELDALDSHLICHSDAEGFYVPAPFARVLEDEDGDLPGGLLGSTVQLMLELRALAPALGIALAGDTLSDAEARRLDASALSGKGLYREHGAWLVLHEAARSSLATGSVMVFS